MSKTIIVKVCQRDHLIKSISKLSYKTLISSWP